jgi:hypothetical protein
MIYDYYTAISSAELLLKFMIFNIDSPLIPRLVFSNSLLNFYVNVLSM